MADEKENFRPDFPAPVVSLGGKELQRFTVKDLRRYGGELRTFEPEPRHAEIFTVDVKEVCEPCPIAGEKKIVILREVFDEWVRLAGHYKVEWLAYCLGEVKDNEAVITGFYFPPQKASGAHCENIEDITVIRPGTIGAVHSHVNMGVFWSGEDRAHCNWPIELVLNSKGQMKGLFRFELECGRMARLDAKVVVRGKQQEPASATELDKAFQEGAAWEAEHKKPVYSSSRSSDCLAETFAEGHAEEQSQQAQAGFAFEQPEPGPLM